MERSRAFKILTWWEVQRCTAIKQIMVHSDVAEEFVAKFTAKVGGLKLGLPWEAGVDLTPLAEPSKPHYLSQLCQVTIRTKFGLRSRERATVEQKLRAQSERQAQQLLKVSEKHSNSSVA